jgi:hypothetical protein
MGMGLVGDVVKTHTVSALNEELQVIAQASGVAGTCVGQLVSALVSSGARYKRYVGGALIAQNGRPYPSRYNNVD